MFLGNPKKRIDYNSFLVKKFVPHLYCEAYGRLGCGATLLSLLTGENPLYIKNNNEYNPNEWTDKFLINYLRRRKFRVVQLASLEVTNFDSYENPIKLDHVIIVSQIFNRKDSSWSCIYNGRIYHNFVISNFDNYEFLNRPILTAYLVWHKDWSYILH